MIGRPNTFHCIRAFALACLVWCLAGPARAADGEQPATATAAGAAEDDVVRKAQIMNGQHWRRAIFELGEWLSAQQIYTADEVRRIKANFNRRVAAMSSYELEYLLEDLDSKFKILDTPEAKDVRSWVGQYLSAMSDRKRAEVLKDVPDVVTMSASQLQREIEKIEQTRTAIQQRSAAFDQSRQQLVERAAAARQQTAAAAAAATAAAQSGASYSPYRSGGQGGGKPPFSDVHGSGMSVSVGPFGAYVNFNVGNF
jgi:methyl-accepting chemotaxis protein